MTVYGTLDHLVTKASEKTGASTHRVKLHICHTTLKNSKAQNLPL